MKKSRQKSKQQCKLRKIWEQNYTNTWAGLQGLSAALLAGITGVSGILSSSQFSDVLNTIAVPWFIPFGIAVLALITYVMNSHDA